MGPVPKRFPCSSLLASGEPCTRTFTRKSDCTLHVNKDHLFQSAFCATCQYLYTTTRYGVTHMLRYHHHVLEVMLVPGEENEDCAILATRFESRFPVKVLPTEKMSRTKSTTRRYPISHHLPVATVSNVPTTRCEILPAAASGSITPVPVTSSTPVLKQSKKQKSPTKSSSAAPTSLISHPATVTTPATVVSKTVLASQPISVVIMTPAEIDIPSYPQSPSPPELTIDEGPGPSQHVTISVTLTLLFSIRLLTFLSQPSEREPHRNVHTRERDGSPTQRTFSPCLTSRQVVCKNMLSFGRCHLLPYLLPHHDLSLRYSSPPSPQQLQQPP
jgi:hypothetical protein